MCFWSHHWPTTTPAKTTGNQFSPIKPAQSIGNLDDYMVRREGDSTLQKVALKAPRPRDGSWEPPARWAGRSKSGVNKDEEWQREKSCVFSQGDVFSPLSSAQAI